MTLTVTNASAGSGQLLRATVNPFPRENLSLRATMVQVRNAAEEEYMTTGVRLRAKHLIAVNSSVNTKYRAACKDINDVWSEWSQNQNFTLSSFATGDNAVSIGSGQSEDLFIEEPALRFPDLSVGSGQIWTHRTLVAGGVGDEQRRSKWPQGRASFHVVLSELDEDQTALLHRFFRCLNGPLTPFWFEYFDPNDGDRPKRYVVRFREPDMTTELFGVTISRADFYLIEVVGASTGGPV
jgi:hypothetical protein